ncbi:hypothetical protein, partial [Parathermosynechococcus lividus]
MDLHLTVNALLQELGVKLKLVQIPHENYGEESQGTAAIFRGGGVGGGTRLSEKPSSPNPLYLKTREIDRHPLD